MVRFNGVPLTPRPLHTFSSSVLYSVRFNGVPLASFSPSCGLRQGDPLSLYLFLLVADGLSVLLDHYKQLGLLEEIKVCRRAPSISHLLFVNDSLLFFRTSEVQAQHVKNLLEIFEKNTSQLLSPSKCSLLVRDGSDGEAVDR